MFAFLVHGEVVCTLSATLRAEKTTGAEKALGWTFRKTLPLSPVSSGMRKSPRGCVQPHGLLLHHPVICEGCEESETTNTPRGAEPKRPKPGTRNACVVQAVVQASMILPSLTLTAGEQDSRTKSAAVTLQAVAVHNVRETLTWDKCCGDSPAVAIHDVLDACFVLRRP